MSYTAIQLAQKARLRGFVAAIQNTPSMTLAQLTELERGSYQIEFEQTTVGDLLAEAPEQPPQVTAGNFAAQLTEVQAEVLSFVQRCYPRHWVSSSQIRVGLHLPQWKAQYTLAALHLLGRIDRRGRTASTRYRVRIPA